MQSIKNTIPWLTHSREISSWGHRILNLKRKTTTMFMPPCGWYLCMENRKFALNNSSECSGGLSCTICGSLSASFHIFSVNTEHVLSTMKLFHFFSYFSIGLCEKKKPIRNIGISNGNHMWLFRFVFALTVKWIHYRAPCSMSASFLANITYWYWSLCDPIRYSLKKRHKKKTNLKKRQKNADASST